MGILCSEPKASRGRGRKMLNPQGAVLLEALYNACNSRGESGAGQGQSVCKPLSARSRGNFLALPIWKWTSLMRLHPLIFLGPKEINGFTSAAMGIITVT